MIMEINKFDSKVILIAIYLYLDSYFHEGLDELGAFLSSLTPIIDGSPADPALYEDWCEIINNKENLEKEEAYHYMFEFIKMQSSMGWSEIEQFIKNENLQTSNKQISIQQLSRWNDAINKALEYNL
jgi:hypothetical protein